VKKLTACPTSHTTPAALVAPELSTTNLLFYQRYILKDKEIIPLRVGCLGGKQIDVSYSIKRNLLLSKEDHYNQLT